ncbi:alpha-ketoglutarate-dependent dioxygenase AlkB family protein [Agaribacter flavus]|uniref:Alpha-ketoglutarate-dependent dioxygenase AlkB family protein n=1 Tax=Agaribacter flavus TaxID=1902781 RepID=A0ABV7FP38_9ALTE
MHTLAMPDADVVYVPQFVKQTEATAFFEQLYCSLPWSQDDIYLFGKRTKIPRLQVWYGDKDARYIYSGLLMQPKPWTPLLLALKARCESKCQARFNSVLANLYRDGQDSMGMHADDEIELGNQPVIASITLGAERQFIFKHKNTKQKVALLLKHGSLLIMRGLTQSYWQHGMNKTKRVHTPRINLTFRYINRKSVER